MAKRYNRVRFTTATTGTGTITVGSAIAGCRTPAQASIPTGTVIRLFIEDGTAWEESISTYTTVGTTCTRTLVDSSTGALLNLSGAAVAFIADAAEDVDAYGTFRVWRNSVVQSGLTAATSNKVQLTTEVVDSDNVFDSVTNFRYQPLQAGYYQIVGAIVASANGETPEAILEKNGAAIGTGGNYLSAGAGTSSWTSLQSELVQLNGTTDFVELFAYVPAGVTSISGASYMYGFKVHS